MNAKLKNTALFLDDDWIDEDLIDYLEQNKYQEELWFDYSPKQLVQKVMNENAMRFYKRFFV